MGIWVLINKKDLYLKGYNGNRIGYGVDENTALVVEGNKGTVLGENGVFIIDMTTAAKMPD